jgi:hypothetical protein
VGFTAEMISEGGRFAPEKLALRLAALPLGKVPAMVVARVPGTAFDPDPAMGTETIEVFGDEYRPQG